MGLSVDTLGIRQAQDFQRGVVSEFDVNDADTTVVNPRVGVSYTPAENGRLRFIFARKGRLPTIKDRYSYRLGQAIPNPDLRSERANN